jgi:predicted glycogen debranching enzyme
MTIRRLLDFRNDETIADDALSREWIVTNGLGGYSSGTVIGACTRRYHGLLVSSLPAPHGRVMMLNHMSEVMRLGDGRTARLGAEEARGALDWHGRGHLAEFRVELGLPVWVYDLGGVVVEKRIVMPHAQNTVHVLYRIVEGTGPVRLKLRPACQFRGHDHPVSTELGEPLVLKAIGDQYELTGPPDFPSLRLRMYGGHRAFTCEARRIEDVIYRVEGSRGYEAAGSLFSPGYFRATLMPDCPAALVASTESFAVMEAMTPTEALAAEVDRRASLLLRAPKAAQHGVGAELCLAADQFLVTPVCRQAEAARARAAGEDLRSVIAGYHWFTDWGRDTMISLEGLTLSTGRVDEARLILQTFAESVRDGLIPNLFPEGGKEGLYHTADATLWMFHAVDRYMNATQDATTLARLLPKLEDIAKHHIRGTRYGIKVDERDGLLRQGEAGYQLTWMDAKCDGWVVTPRRGKAVEINALWYNALRLLERWVGGARGAAAARAYGDLADRVQTSFNARFWFELGAFLYDVVDGEDGKDDPACRPNQLLAISLPHPVLAEERWRGVLDAVRGSLLTPKGLRSLSRDHPDYKPTYHGDLKTRDAAYHQGTVWSWLIGPYVDAHLRVHPGDNAGARAALDGLLAHLGEAGVGTVSEVFDAEAPYTARGCIAQAWGVAELLRVYLKVGAG